ncbi:hypothetical protein, partial [Kutzneria kofuensis]|uniref:hypothetical protein n=1 Tax=Kutzneria kofuensis TaxID=103725 RepID=UPI0031EF5C6A
AAYLHGSFGSGKSHFMAVLHALLRGDQAALARTEFDSVLNKHQWLDNGKKFLLVPYHMLGAKSLEQRVLGGYVSHVSALHPDAPTPAGVSDGHLVRRHPTATGAHRRREVHRGPGPAGRIGIR